MPGPGDPEQRGGDEACGSPSALLPGRRAGRARLRRPHRRDLPDRSAGWTESFTEPASSRTSSSRTRRSDSFDRVFDTKADSAFVLSRKLRPESLKFLVFFSSVAGRFGNRGQADYAAANEVLNKLAIYLDRAWPGRVVSMNWGPWATTGMVSPEVRRQFAERGVDLIPPSVGRRRLEEELHYGRQGEVEVIIGGGDLDEAGRRAESTAARASSERSSDRPLAGRGTCSGRLSENHSRARSLLRPLSAGSSAGWPAGPAAGGGDGDDGGAGGARLAGAGGRRRSGSCSCCRASFCEGRKGAFASSARPPVTLLPGTLERRGRDLGTGEPQARPLPGHRRAGPAAAGSAVPFAPADERSAPLPAAGG